MNKSNQGKLKQGKLKHDLKMVCVDVPSKKLTSSLAGSDGSTILAVPSMKLTVPLALEIERVIHVENILVLDYIVLKFSKIVALIFVFVPFD